jgi:hypothetical protein
MGKLSPFSADTWTPGAFACWLPFLPAPRLAPGLLALTDWPQPTGPSQLAASPLAYWPQHNE